MAVVGWVAICRGHEKVTTAVKILFQLWVYLPITGELLPQIMKFGLFVNGMCRILIMA